MRKDFQLNMRMSKELHEEVKREAIRRSSEKNEFISVAEVIREMLEKKFMKNEK